MSADFSGVARHLADGLTAHAARDYPGDSGPDKIRRAVFLDRGGHASGEPCPTAPPPEPRHHYWCGYPDSECECGWTL